MNTKIGQKLKQLPQKPGVYIFKDAKGLFLYVGKAIKLKNRVTSYFRKDAGIDSQRIRQMISRISDLDYIVTDNETESLILENNLIKQIQPRFNVRLRDDKNYLFIKINVKDEIPTIGFERKPSDKTARYFGPYTSALAIKDTLRLVRKVFPYCANKKVGTRPCFYYHIGKCPGVCVGKISLEEYRDSFIKKIIDFLQGRRMEILKDLQARMKNLAQTKQFEKAARVRDQIFALNRVLEKQKLVYPKKVDQDVFSLYQDGVSCVNLFVIREGKLIRKENFILENTKGTNASEIFSEFLPRYYLEASSIPKEILLPIKIKGIAFDKLRQQKDLIPERKSKGQTKILIPQKGTKLELIKLGQQNAKEYLDSLSDKKLLEEARLLSALQELQRILDLPVLPGRIEAYDISNIQGTNPTGSMVVFDYGRPKKEGYRKFKINRKKTPDDFAMMKEMLERRFAHSVIARSASDEAIPQGIATRSATARDDAKWPLPDLILIDGGKGQLSAAVAAISNIKYPISKIPIIALAKRLEEIYLPGQKNPLTLPPNSIALFLLQRIRDEAHRFAVRYHRKLRSKSFSQSTLDQIPGIGPAKKKKLLQTYGSLASIRNAKFSDLVNLVGKKTAQVIKASL